MLNTFFKASTTNFSTLPRIIFTNLFSLEVIT